VDSAKLNDWLQVIGLFGVIASLLFVGLQMKQDREIALSAATQARTETTIQNIMGLMSNPQYLSAVEKYLNGDDDDVTPIERFVVDRLGTTALFNFENVHFQYQQGFIPPERWSASRETLKGLLKTPFGPRRFYEVNPSTWRAPFQQVVDELIAEIDAEAAQ
jgi:hypothetical protein